MIDRRSRYARTPSATFVDATGESLTLISLREIPSVPAVFAHGAVDGDRLDLLAHRYYRDARKGWRIADGADALDPWDVVVPGQPVRVPPDR